MSNHYHGYRLINHGYYPPDRCVWWEAENLKTGEADFRATTRRQLVAEIDLELKQTKMSNTPVSGRTPIDHPPSNTKATFATILRDEEAALRKVGLISKRYRARAALLLAELAKDFPVTGIFMGMGGYALRGSEKLTVHEEGVGEYGVDIAELFDHAQPDRRYYHKVVGLTERHKAVLIELQGILEHVSDTPHLPTFDLP